MGALECSGKGWWQFPSPYLVVKTSSVVKVRAELRLEGGQGVCLAPCRGRPREREELPSKSSPAWRNSKEALVTGRWGARAKQEARTLWAVELGFYSDEMEEPYGLWHGLTYICLDCSGCCFENRLYRVKGRDGETSRRRSRDQAGVIGDSYWHSGGGDQWADVNVFWRQRHRISFYRKFRKNSGSRIGLLGFWLE